MSLSVVISGGQTGVDQAGLVAAKNRGLCTGGYAPRGWKTLDGPAPWLADYGLVECASPNYADRTRANVGFADATIRIAQDFCSPGELCTKKAIAALGKPDFSVGYLMDDPWELVAFLKESKAEILNVAGNAEQTCPGIYLWSVRFLITVFGLLEEK